jgi:aldehyde dehydrogenase (NAD+)
MSISSIVAQQRAYFATGVTRPVSFRLEMLRRLRRCVEVNQDALCAALQQDLGKSHYEGYCCEVGLVLSELSHLIRHTKGYAARKRVRTPLAQFAAASYVQPSPYGNVLIISPWNYPVLLTLDPLADAIAAGNTAVVKPSAYAPATSALLAKLIGELFPAEYVAVVTGGRQENQALLDEKFDLVFFTGSQTVGKEVLRRTAEHLTPAVLELGGKSPCIVDDSAKIGLAARRIVFGKFLNCGQTCVAPDYVLCQSGVKDQLISALCDEIKTQFGEYPLENPDYGHIINEKHFNRLCGLLTGERILWGGETNPASLQIAPTILDQVSWDAPVMGEEIFGPILPILTYDKTEELFALLNGKPKPLALYYFSEDKVRCRQVTEGLSFGGGCINDTVIHLATSQMGFGGVGESGMGAYHGKVGFDTFSHHKSMVDKKTWMDLPLRYQPYKKGFNEKLLHLFLK